ncbi:CmpA/NrtA family ABC transporter substrate-binding protein [Xanthocytophaga agilis]|uniref:CmpA/NrtA family ABC transporter substrate-binding protein n=1 Tax=Xanthocytophaga agilis TaxID=3048010 RepID=A0AAE3QZ76_9BACT|nr:CmpA/NrtA family ABC transporter substrate-binding protein [Xanthocytophaga agilis]MDJ1500751.1 CmpA/NrtA family ABC transporter substrate-binding protein [Xanthocytophaga agilis]
MKKIKTVVQTVVFALVVLMLSSAAGPNAPKKVIKLGFIPLTDCAPLVVAKEMGFFQKYGVEVQLSKEASWANVRDKILNGELQGAHCLFSMPFSVYTGVGGKPGAEMKIAMVLNNNGQGITLSKEFCGLAGFKEYKKVAPAVKAVQAKKEVTFAMTFPGGTHDIWLRNWLAACGVNQKSVGIITIPPPQMVSNMKVDNMEGFCVGEPWNGVAATQNIGFTHVASQDIWKHHPEKALVVNKEFAEASKEDLKNVMKAILEACKWLDNMSNRKKAAGWLTKPNYVNAPLAVIEARLLGSNDLGCDLGVQKYKDDCMTFFNNGFVNAPRKSHGIWFMAQYVRFGYLKSDPEYKAIAEKLVLDDLYNEVAKSMNVVLPNDDMKPFRITIDPTPFDPNNPEQYVSLAKK